MSKFKVWWNTWMAPRTLGTSSAVVAALNNLNERVEALEAKAKE